MNPHARGSILGIILILALLSSAAAFELFRSGLVESGGQGVFETGPCELTVVSTTTVYTRPSINSLLFAELPAGTKVTVAGITAKSWFGFDPGVAQAPNSGPFRLRYVAPDTGALLSGNCADVPTVPTVAPRTCFTMAETVTPIYSSRSSTSSIVAVMHLGDYIEATAESGRGSPNYFLQVNSREGSLPEGVVGWIEGRSGNLNGPCSKLRQG